MDYPKVDQAICTGCGICIELCPLNTIVMENDSARIIKDNCSICRFCVGTCSFGAIN